MEQHELLLYVVECFEKLEIPYLITGPIASIAYGEPRLTNNIDIVADISLEQIDEFKMNFAENEFYLEVDSMKAAINQRRQFNIIHPASGLKVDVMLSKKDEFDLSRFSRIKKLNVTGTKSANWSKSSLSSTTFPFSIRMIKVELISNLFPVAGIPCQSPL